MIFRLLVLLALAAASPVLAQSSSSATSEWVPENWDLEESEFEPEPGWHFGKLDNGLRYIIRRNNRPENTALVRMEIAVGSLDERDDEQGYAHYVEHMAFNGSTNVPEGEMIKLLERQGLAFGADTNASTSFDRTQYKLDLPRADEELLDTALMLMRETASELTFAEDAVEREKGVILSERRTRNTFTLKALIDGLEFLYPDALMPRRLPIGTIEALQAAGANKLRAFWQREYVPSDTVIVVVGDFEPEAVASRIEKHFGGWAAAISPDQPEPGPIDFAREGDVDIYLDPALPESLSVSLNIPHADQPDTLERRRQALLRSIGMRIISRRLQRLNRTEDPPFRSARIASPEFFESARTPTLTVVSEEGGWKQALEAAMDEYRRALTYGFSEAEIDEQIRNSLTQYENAVANVETRSNTSFVAGAFAMARGEYVPTGPQSTLERFASFAPLITSEAIVEALREHFPKFTAPLIRFSGRTAPEGGPAALKAAVHTALARAISPPEMRENVEFAYTDFGEPGTIVEDTRTPELGIRTLRFANGVMLNLKQTDLADDRVIVRLALDGGAILKTREEPLAVELTGLFASGGLGEHSRDELQSILAGRSVGASLGASSDTFVSSATTTPRDLELQLQLMTAFLTDPGYRPEGIGPWRKGLDDFFARLGRTPGSALAEALGPALSDGDPRFSRQPIEAYRALDYAALSRTLDDRLANGAIEVALVGDLDEDAAIALVGKTLGALPPREASFREYSDERRERTFTSDRSPKTVTHKGEPDQAQLMLIWPTTDAEDWDLTSRLTLLSRVMRLELTETLREELGQTYSPSASSNQSFTFPGYGTFSVGAAVSVDDVSAARTAMLETVTRIIADGPSQDTLDRARRPLIESIENRLKTNRGWMGLVDRAQSRPEDIARHLQAKERQLAITAGELQALARTYLNPENAIEFTVVPEAQTED